MREAFKKIYGHFPTEDSFLWAGFKEGYQAAIAAVKEGGPIGYKNWVPTIGGGLFDVSRKQININDIPLYKLPEDK